jgi:hypothetical protein
MRLLAAASLVACAFVVAADPPGSAGRQADAHVVTLTDRFALRSDPRVALHHFLLDWAMAEAGEWPPYAPPVREREGWRDSLTADEARTWSAAVAAYDAGRGRSLLFDTGLVSVRDWAAGLVELVAVPSADRPLSAAVESALPVYLRRWWPEHDRRNRAWIASVAPMLDDVEEAVIPRLEAAYGGTWPAGRIPVDVMVHANDVGAYSVGGRVTISSGNRNIVMPHAVDLVFHEASHVDGLEAPLTSAVAEAFRAAGGEAPERLWHDVIFFTTGEILRIVLEERGRPGFRPYAEAAGVYSRGERWATALPALRRHWLPFLASGSADAVGRRRALEGVARTLLGR